MTTTKRPPRDSIAGAAFTAAAVVAGGGGLDVVEVPLVGFAVVDVLLDVLVVVTVVLDVLVDVLDLLVELEGVELGVYVNPIVSVGPPKQHCTLSGPGHAPVVRCLLQPVMGAHSPARPTDVLQVPQVQHLMSSLPSQWPASKVPPPLVQEAVAMHRPACPLLTTQSVPLSTMADAADTRKRARTERILKEGRRRKRRNMQSQMLKEARLDRME